MRGQLLYINGEQVARMELSLPDDVPFGFIAVPQYATEAVLRDELANYGVRTERGVRLVGFVQDADGVATLAGSDRPNVLPPYDLPGTRGRRQRYPMSMLVPDDLASAPSAGSPMASKPPALLSCTTSRPCWTGSPPNPRQRTT